MIEKENNKYDECSVRIIQTTSHPEHIDCAAGPEGHRAAKGEAQHGGSCLGDVRTTQCVFGRDTATGTSCA